MTVQSTYKILLYLALVFQNRRNSFVYSKMELVSRSLSAAKTEFSMVVSRLEQL